MKKVFSFFKRLLSFEVIFTVGSITSFILFPDKPFWIVTRLALIGLVASVVVRILTLDKVKDKYKIIVGVVLLISGSLLFKLKSEKQQNLKLLFFDKSVAQQVTVERSKEQSIGFEYELFVEFEVQIPHIDTSNLVYNGFVRKNEIDVQASTPGWFQRHLDKGDRCYMFKDMSRELEIVVVFSKQANKVFAYYLLY